MSDSLPIPPRGIFAFPGLSPHPAPAESEAIVALADRRIRHVLFDWDGTVVDSHGHIVSAFVEAVQEVIGVIPDLRLVEALVGRPVEAMFLAVVGKAQLLPRLLEAFERQYVKGCAIRPEPVLPGVLALLCWLLSTEGIRASVTSNKRAATLLASVASSGLASLFDSLQDAQNYPGKPDPAMGRAIQCRGGWAAGELLMIGDSDVDEKFARALGCPFLRLIHSGVTGPAEAMLANDVQGRVQTYRTNAGM